MDTIMALAKLKEKGQITLPVGIRKKLKAEKGDLFDFEIVDGKIIMTLQKVVPAKNKQTRRRKRGVDISKYMGIGNGAFGKTAEEADEYIRKERASWD